MKELFKTKYFKWGITLFVTLSAVVIVFLMISRASGFADAVRTMGSILQPFFYGIVIAYVLKPVYNGCYFRTERFLLDRGVRKKSAGIVAGTAGAVVSMVLFIGIIAGLLIMIVPQLISSIVEILKFIPVLTQKALIWVDGLTFIGEDAKDIMGLRFEDLFGSLNSWLSSTVLPYFQDLALKLSHGIWDVAKGFFNFFIGMIIAVYILLGKNRFSAQAKKASFSLFSGETANRLIYAARYTDTVFTNFVLGNLIDALIIGIVTLVVMMLFGWPLPVLVAVIVGLTNLIPFFGPFIGGGIGALLILMESPLTALYFLIYILIIQQIDGNIIKPKVLGTTTDLSSFWVLFSILVGGGFFGIWGLFLGVPCFTLIYAIVSWFVETRLKKKNLPEDTDEYDDVKEYNTESGEFERLPEDYVMVRIREHKEERRQRKAKKKQED